DPLNAILFTANAQLSRTDGPADGGAKAAARTRTAAERMDRMIRDLLDFAPGRLGGGFSIVPTRFDARTLIGPAMHEFADSHPDREVRSSAEHAAGTFDVDWDSDRIAQIVANLVGNALVHGEDPVTLEMIDGGDEVAIVVSNRGEIPGDILPRLFDPFVSDAPPNIARNGLGLGLYIVQQIAHAHGGTARAESSNGMTTMTVTLPRRARARSNAS